jgi:hypothetical protein
MTPEAQIALVAALAAVLYAIARAVPRYVAAVADGRERVAKAEEAAALAKRDLVLAEAELRKQQSTSETIVHSALGEVYTRLGIVEQERDACRSQIADFKRETNERIDALEERLIEETRQKLAAEARSRSLRGELEDHKAKDRAARPLPPLHDVPEAFREEPTGRHTLPKEK